MQSALCKACSFTVFCQKKCHKKKKKKVTPGWTDISDPGPVSFLSRSSMYYITLTLQNPIKPLNIFSTNSFPGGPNFASATTWCTDDLRRLQLARINDLRRLKSARINNSLFSLLICQEEINRLFLFEFTNQKINSKYVSKQRIYIKIMYP